MATSRRGETSKFFGHRSCKSADITLCLLVVHFILQNFLLRSVQLIQQAITIWAGETLALTGIYQYLFLSKLFPFAYLSTVLLLLYVHLLPDRVNFSEHNFKVPMVRLSHFIQLLRMLLFQILQLLLVSLLQTNHLRLMFLF